MRKSALLWLFGFFVILQFPTFAKAACSSYMGDATINEVYRLGDTKFVELKILDQSIGSSIYNDWSIQGCDTGGCATYTLDSASADYPYLVIPNVDHIDLSQGGEMDIVLVDSSDNAIDYLSVNASSLQDPACTSFPYPTSVETTSNIKGIYRFPDGTGEWSELEDSGAGGEPSEGEDNTATEPVVGGFNAYETDTEAGAITGVIRTKVAGEGFELDIVAIDNQGDSILTTYKKTVQVDLLDATDNSEPLDGDGCRDSWTVIQTLSEQVTFEDTDNGRKTVTFAENNAWENVRAKVTSLTGQAKTGCSTDNFAIRPDVLTFNASDGDWETAGKTHPLDNSSETGGNVHKAGRPFTLEATAINAIGDITTNYAGQPDGAVLSACTAGPACPPTPGTLHTDTWSSPSPSDGSVITNKATYSEVGSFDLTLEDRTFAEVDADDTDPGQRYIRSEPTLVGRFVPDHFLLTADSTPEFLTFNDSTCATRTFTYIGQPFGYATEPVIEITAQNFSDVTTTNYAGDLWKIDGSDVGQTYAASNSLDTGLIGTPTVTSNGNGTGRIAPNGSDLLAFTRSGAVAPFDAGISLSVSVIDADGVVDNGDAAFNGTGNGIAFDSGNEFRFGRLALQNAFGPEILPLTIPLNAEYFDGDAFIPNSADFCTAYDAATELNLDTFYPELAEGDTDPEGAGTLISGMHDPVNPMVLNPPGEGNHGSVDLSLAVSDWLKFDWNDDGTDDNPTARATFGIYKGNPRVIYMREVY